MLCVDVSARNPTTRSGYLALFKRLIEDHNMELEKELINVDV
jgi:hypothetical protein